MTCKDCKKAKREEGPRCRSCHRKWKTAAATVRRVAKRKELIDCNAELEKVGRRVCTVCHYNRCLSEFSPRKRGVNQVKRNKVCDRCLTRIYNNPARKSADSQFTYEYWRKKAYSLNSVCRSRETRGRGRTVSLNQLPLVFRPQDLADIFQRQKGLCGYCGCELTPQNCQGDHCTPLSRGGTHTPDNIRLCCTDCNYLKHTRTEEEFLAFVVQYARRFVSVAESADKELSR